MIEIKWNDLILVAGASIGASALVVTLFSIGIRLFTNSVHVVASKAKSKSSAAAKEIAFKLASFVSFGLAAAVLTYGLYIMVTFSKLQK